MDIKMAESYKDVKVKQFKSDKGYDIVCMSGKDIEPGFEIIVRTPAFDNSGISHITEHCICSGNERTGQLTSLYRSSRTGNRFNAFVKVLDGITVFKVKQSSDRGLLDSLETIADAVFNPAITEDTFRTQAWNVTEVDGKKKLGGVIPAEQMNEIFLLEEALGKVYDCKSMGHIAGGVPSEIVKTSVDMVREYHKKYYCPNNARVVVFGNAGFTDEAFKEIEGHLPYVGRSTDLDVLARDTAFRRVETVSGSCSVATAAKHDSVMAVYHMDAPYPMMLQDDGILQEYLSCFVNKAHNVKGFMCSSRRPLKAITVPDGILIFVRYLKMDDKAVFNDAALRKAGLKLVRGLDRSVRKNAFKPNFPLNAEWCVEYSYAYGISLEEIFHGEDCIEGARYSLEHISYMGSIELTQVPDDMKQEKLIRDFVKTAEVTPFTPEKSGAVNDSLSKKEFIPTSYRKDSHGVYLIESKESDVVDASMSLSLNSYSLNECKDIMVFMRMLAKSFTNVVGPNFTDSASGLWVSLGLKYYEADEKEYLGLLYKAMSRTTWKKSQIDSFRSAIFCKNDTGAEDMLTASSYISSSHKWYELRMLSFYRYILDMSPRQFNRAYKRGFKLFSKGSIVAMRSDSKGYIESNVDQFMSHFSLGSIASADVRDSVYNINPFNKTFRLYTYDDQRTLFVVSSNGSIKERAALGVIFKSIKMHELWEGLRNKGLVYSENVLINEFCGRYVISTLRDVNSETTAKSIEAILKSLKDKEWTQSEIDESINSYRGMEDGEKFYPTNTYLLNGFTDDLRREVFDIRSSLTAADIHEASVRLYDILENGQVLRICRKKEK